MSPGVIAIIAAIVAGGLFFILAKLALRFFIRLALAGAIILLAIVCGALAWWHGLIGSTASPRSGNRPPATRRATAR